jgi:hypothetical protein
MAGMKHHDFDRIQRIKESEASVDCRESLDKFEANFSINWSCTNQLFGTPSESEDATDARGNALDTLTTEYLEQDPEPEDSAPDEDGNECAAAESDEEIVDETIRQSPMKNRTRSKSLKVFVPEPLLPSDSEDKESRPQPRKHKRASPAPLRAYGHARYFRRNSNQFPSIASKKLAVRKGKAGRQGRK